MPHCIKCGNVVAGSAGFCPNCGAPQANTPAPAPASAAGAQSGLAENVAALLCYALGWLTGLIFFLIDNRPTVRFHAAQSIVVFGGLNILTMVLRGVLGLSFFGGWGMGWSWGAWGMFGAILGMIQLVGLVLWILLMVKAYQGGRYKLPIAGDLAESFVK